MTQKKNLSETDETILRIYVGYRQLEKIIKKHINFLPNTYDKIQLVISHQYYTFLDIENEFWYIQMHPDESKKTALVTKFGVYEFCIVPFVLCNAWANLKSFMEKVLNLFHPNVVGLLDDVDVWGNSIEELYSQLLLIFIRFSKYDLILNSKKYRSFFPSNIYL